MKNVYIIDDYASSKTNGIGSYIRELTYCLQELGVNVCIVVLNCEIDRFSMTYEDGVQKMLLPSMPGYYFNNYKIINVFLRLYINDSSDNLFLINHSPCELFLKSLKESFPKSKTVFVIHDMGWTFKLLGDTKKLKKVIQTMDSEEIRKEYKNLIDYFLEEQRMYKIVDKIIVLAKETETLLKEIYVVKEQKTFYTPNGLRDSYIQLNNEDEIILLKKKLHLNRNEKIILYTGRIDQVKGSYQLLNCFERVLQQYPDCRLVIVGTLFEPYKILKYSSDVAAKVTFTGQVTAKKVREWYSVANIGVLPSYLEQCSYTGIEMMMYGLPIVTSDGFCLGNMFTDGENAKIAKIENRDNPEVYENNLASAIIELLTSEDICKKLSYNAREQYKSHYNIINMQNNYRILFESLNDQY